MILRELCDYYDTLIEENNKNLPKFGYTLAKVHFGIAINKEGEIKRLVDRKDECFIMPYQAPRSSGIFPYFLNDKSEYIFGVSKEKNKPLKITKDYFEASKKLHLDLLKDVPGEGAKAVINFFENHNPEKTLDILNSIGFVENELAVANFIFMLDGVEYIHEDPQINKKWMEKFLKFEGEEGICLISGQKDVIERLHPKIKGVSGAQSSGANIVSFNLESFTSYGKEQSYNSPVGKRAAFKYGTILNYLLRKGSKQKVLFGDSTLVYWSKSANTLQEDIAKAYISPFFRDDQTEDELKSLLEAVKKGRPVEGLDEGREFCLLMLTPNNARISITFFYKNTFKNFLDRFNQHFKDMELEGVSPRSLHPYRLVKDCVGPSASPKFETKLYKKLFESILYNRQYPEGLFYGALERCKVERKVTRERASIIKGYLTRNKEEIPMELDEKEKDKGYLCGRIFAILEKIQKKAQPKIGANIKDKYFDYASKAPLRILTKLIGLSTHHFKKLDPKIKNYYDKLLGETIKELDGEIPAKFTVKEGAKFMMGYYQEKYKPFNKPGEENEDIEAEDIETEDKENEDE